MAHNFSIQTFSTADGDSDSDADSDGDSDADEDSGDNEDNPGERPGGCNACSSTPLPNGSLAVVAMTALAGFAGRRRNGAETSGEVNPFTLP